MKKISSKFFPEVIERAVRMVFKSKGGYDSEWATIVSIAAKIRSTPKTLRRWVRQHERATGGHEGPTTVEQERIKALEREVR